MSYSDNEEKTVKYQHRATNVIKPRALLENASMNDMQNIFEKDMLLKYQNTLRQLNQKEQELHDTHELWSNIHAGNDKSYLAMQKSLQESASHIASQIDALDRNLRDLEQDAILLKVIERERAKAIEIAEQKAKQRREEDIARAKERAAQTERELMARYQESRQKYLQKKQEQQETLKQSNTLEQPKPNQQDNISSIKEKLIATLGSLGIILFYGLRLLICILPFVMIGGNFFVTFLLISIDFLFPIVSPIFWIWGLVCAIKGVQDFWAILYYIAFIVMWIPFYISTITRLFSKK